MIKMPLIIIAFAIALGERFYLRANGEQPLGQSSVTNDLSFTIDGAIRGGEHLEGDTLLSTDAIIYKFLSAASEEIKIAIPRKSEYLCRMTLTDSNKREIPKTALGATFGTKFFANVSYYESEPFRWKAFPGPYKCGGGHRLYSVGELFKLSVPGKYTLEIQFQAYKQEDVMRLVQFPPIRVTVSKE